MLNVESQVDNCDPEEEQKATKRKLSLSNCGVCESEEAKYKCPACLACTCSLVCVKKHKSDTGCSGVRNKTAFVTLSHFDEMNLLSDYRFLEDTGRFANGATRDDLIRTPRCNFKAKRLAICASKMNITLRFLPVTFTKSKENSTFFLRAKKQFLWHLKLIFPQSSTEFSQRRVSDDQKLIQILTAYIHPTESDPVTRQKLKMYVHHPFDHVKVFMKAEGRKANSVRFHELDMQKSLRENLSYKTLIEYPVLHVVLRDYWKDFPLKGPGNQAEPASACTSSAPRNVWMEMEKTTKEDDKVTEEEENEGKKEEEVMEIGKEVKTKGEKKEEETTKDKDEKANEEEKTKEEDKAKVGIDLVEKTTKEEEKIKQEEKEATKNTQHIQRSCTPEGTNICTKVQKTTPEPESPLEKRARRGEEEDEREEGEIIDSSDEEDRMQSQ